MSVIIPAHNEAGYIGACLEAVLASRGPRHVEIIVAANGCSDETTQIAARAAVMADTRGWPLKSLDLPEGGKIGALNAADQIAKGDIRVYLDADVLVSPELLLELSEALDDPMPRYASGSLQISPADGHFTSAYARIYAKVPFMSQGVPGAGLFAVNAAGRARWGAFPPVISDDTFVRLSFAPSERVAVKAPYQWPLVEGFRRLVKVRRRQNAGVDEIQEFYPGLLANDDKPKLGLMGTARLALRDPLGFLAYGAVALSVRLTRGLDGNSWSRGR